MHTDKIENCNATGGNHWPDGGKIGRGSHMFTLVPDSHEKKNLFPPPYFYYYYLKSSVGDSDSLTN